MTDAAEACSKHTPVRSVLSQWFALRLQSNCEFKVQKHLQALGIDEFLPTWAEKVKWSDREKVTVRPLFTGYIFCKFANCEAGRFSRRHSYTAEVLSIPGVVQILPTSIAPIQISDAEIENLKLVLASQLPVTPCAYVAGETVTIESGAFTGVSGVVQRTKGSAWLIVRIPMLNAAVNVEIDAATVTRCAVE